MATGAAEPQYRFPSESWSAAVDRLSELLGVQNSYWDIWGHEHHPSDEVRIAVLRSMGVDTTDVATMDAAARKWLEQERLALLPVCSVTSASEPWIVIAVEGSGEAELAIALEDGGEVRRRERIENLAVEDEIEVDGIRRRRLRFPLPEDLPLGYHRARVRLCTGLTEACVAECLLIHCPDKVYRPQELTDGGKCAGIAVSLYGLRSERNWGCGDFTDLARFATWARGEAGAAFVALNPLHALANRSPYNTSPYLPASTFYRNFLYIDIEAVPEFADSPLAARLRDAIAPRLAELRSAEFVDYEGVSRTKLLFLLVLYRQFLRGNAERRSAFDEYRKREGDLLHRFAIYCALDRWIHRRKPDIWIWPDWPEEYRDPDSDAVRDFAREQWQRVEFWQYVCWITDRQAAEAQAHAVSTGMAIGLYHDLALATDRCGSDLWAHRPFYIEGCRVGAPPDDFSPKGQDWSFPPPNALRHREDGYRLFAAAIRNNSRHGGALRIDHVMRFFRLYWIPEGMDATKGTYVREHWRDLLRIVALESHRNRVMVIGEDLGTVEDYVREGLSEFGVLSYRLLYFERGENGRFKRPDEYPALSVVSSTTHDLPTLAGFWLGRDIEARRSAGLLMDEAGYRDQLRARLEDKHKLIEVLHDLRLLPEGYPRDAGQSRELTGELHSAVIGFLASAASMLFVLNQEDLTKETEQQNLPGSTWEYPNWKRKMRYSLEELETSEQLKDFTRMLRGWLERTGRL